MTITLTWWMIPLVVTVSGIIWALFIHDDGGGYFSGLGNILMLIPVLMVSCLAWIIAAFFK